MSDFCLAEMKTFGLHPCNRPQVCGYYYIHTMPLQTSVSLLTLKHHSPAFFSLKQSSVISASPSLCIRTEMSTAFPRTAVYQRPKHGSRSTGVNCTLLSPCLLSMTINELDSLPKKDASESSSYLWYTRNAAALTSNRCRIDVFQSHSDRFLKALEICQKSVKKGIKDLDMGKVLSWDDVMAEYEHACLIYDAKAKGWRGLPRNGAGSQATMHHL